MLEQIIKEKKLTKIAIAKSLNMDRGAFSRALNGQASLKAEHIPALAKILKITPTKVLNIYMEDRRNGNLSWKRYNQRIR